MINIKINEPTGTIILDRPSQCNALNRQMIDSLSQAFSDLHQEKRVRGVVLTGAGAHFCTGMDLKELHQNSTSENSLQSWMDSSRALQALIEQMLQFPKPVVAAIDGEVMGSGLALVLACDLVVASQRSVLSVAASKLGLVSGLVAPLACFRCGASLASQLLIGGSRLTAGEAKAIGLVHHVVDPDLIWVRAKTWIESIAEGAAESIQLTKRVLNEMVAEKLSGQLASGAAALATSLTTEAAMEGIGAFVEKRAARFP
jgi:enoyl-CoA hydratase/carnithine racemase